MNIAFVGEEDYIRGFGGLGLSVFPAADAEEAGKIIAELEKQGFSLVFLSEQFAEKILVKIESLVKDGRLNVCIIPGRGKGTDTAARLMRKYTIKATGTDPEKDRQ